MSAVGLQRRLAEHAELHPESREVIDDALALIAELFDISSSLSAALPEQVRPNRMQWFSKEFGIMVRPSGIS